MNKTPTNRAFSNRILTDGIPTGRKSRDRTSTNRMSVNGIPTKSVSAERAAINRTLTDGIPSKRLSSNRAAFFNVISAARPQTHVGAACLKSTSAVGVLILCLVVVFTAGCGDTPEIPTFTGTVESTVVEVGAEIGGRIEAVAVEEGEKVTPGQVVAAMDTTVMELQLEQALAAVETSKAKLAEGESGASSSEIKQFQAELNSAKAGLEGAEKALAACTTQLERIKALHQRGAVSSQELDNVQAEFDQRLAARDRAKAQVEAAAAKLDSLRSGTKKETLNVLRKNVTEAEKNADLAAANLDKSRILAPVGGVATSVNVEPGEIVNQGASVISISDLSNLWVEVYVPEKYLAGINIGDSARVSITPVKNKDFKGKVTFISSEAEFTPEKADTEEERADTVFKVRVKIMEGLGQFKPGMSAEVTFPGLLDQ